MASLTEIEIALIERACARLVLDFAEASDSRNSEALASLFAPGATLVRPNGDALIGPAAIAQAYQSRPAGRLTRHVCSNIRISIDTADAARGKTYAIVYFADASAPTEKHFGVKADARYYIGEFEDEFVRTPEGWRFSKRVCRFVMHADEGRSGSP